MKLDEMCFSNWKTIEFFCYATIIAAFVYIILG
jgi:hypothetical protein